MSPNLKGALLMTASMGSFTLNDVFVKALAQDLPLFQIVFLRGILTTAMLTLLATALGQLSFRIPHGDRPRWPGARCSRSEPWSPSSSRS
jgi:drug/metabolite transporter (DMT)-like permease